jgi:hypothetical protein
MTKSLILLALASGAVFAQQYNILAQLPTGQIVWTPMPVIPPGTGVDKATVTQLIQTAIAALPAPLPPGRFDGDVLTWSGGTWSPKIATGVPLNTTMVRQSDGTYLCNPVLAGTQINMWTVRVTLNGLATDSPADWTYPPSAAINGAVLVTPTWAWPNTSRAVCSYQTK